MLRTNAPPTKRPSRSTVRQRVPRMDANASLSGCSTKTFQCRGSTVAQVLKTF
jgi:hypothetical protein